MSIDGSRVLEQHCGQRIHSCRVGNRRLVIRFGENGHDPADDPALVIEERSRRRGGQCILRSDMDADQFLPGQVLERVWLDGVEVSGPGTFGSPGDEDYHCWAERDLAVLKVRAGGETYEFEVENRHDGHCGGFDLRIAENGNALLALERTLAGLDEACGALRATGAEGRRILAASALDTAFRQRLVAAMRGQWLPLRLPGLEIRRPAPLVHWRPGRDGRGWEPCAR